MDVDLLACFLSCPKTALFMSHYSDAICNAHAQVAIVVGNTQDMYISVAKNISTAKTILLSNKDLCHIGRMQG